MASGIQADSVSRGLTVYNLETDKIYIEEGFNVRQGALNVDDLMDSMRENGYNPRFPIIVKKDSETGKYKVRDGHRRFTAAMRLLCEEGRDEFLTVPVFTEDRNIGPVQAVAEQLTANSGQPYNPVELAFAYKRMYDGVGDEPGWTMEQIAKHVGKSVPHVWGMIRLTGLPAPALTILKNRQVSVNAIQPIANRLATGKITAEVALEQVREIASQTKLVPSGRPRRRANPNTDGRRKGNVTPMKMEKVAEMATRLEEEENRSVFQSGALLAFNIVLGQAPISDLLPLDD